MHNIGRIKKRWVFIPGENTATTRNGNGRISTYTKISRRNSRCWRRGNNKYSRSYDNGRIYPKRVTEIPGIHGDLKLLSDQCIGRYLDIKSCSKRNNYGCYLCIHDTRIERISLNATIHLDTSGAGDRICRSINKFRPSGTSIDQVRISRRNAIENTLVGKAHRKAVTRTYLKCNNSGIFFRKNMITCILIIRIPSHIRRRAV